MKIKRARKTTKRVYQACTQINWTTGKTACESFPTWAQAQGACNKVKQSRGRCVVHTKRVKIKR